MKHTKIRPKLKDGADPIDFDEDDIAGYHMTERRSKRTYPIGYCRDHEPHDTKEEAAQCHEQYTMDHLYDDNRWRYREKQRDRCVICGEWGRYEYVPSAGGWLPFIWACEEHATKETMGQKFSITPSMESFGTI